MHHTRYFVAALVLLVPAAALCAAPPATAPADLSTPRGALRAFAEAEINGDGALMRQVLFVSPGEQAITDAIVARVDAYGSLRSAIMNKFGKQGVEDVLGAGIPDATLQRIDTATVTEQDGVAKVTFADAKAKPLGLVKSDGHWKLPVALMNGSADPARLERQRDVVQRETQTYRQLANEVAANKYGKVEDLRAAVRDRLLEISRAGATQPASN